MKQSEKVLTHLITSGNNKDFVAKMSPGLNLGTPSLMFYSDHLEELQSDLSNKNVIVAEIVTCLLAGYLTLQMMQKITLL